MASAEENTDCARTKLLSLLFLFQLPTSLVVITRQLSMGVGFDDAEKGITVSEHILEGAFVVVVT